MLYLKYLPQIGDIDGVYTPYIKYLQHFDIMDEVSTPYGMSTPS